MTFPPLVPRASSAARAIGLLGVALAALQLVACDLPAKPAHPRLLTVADFAALANGNDPDLPIAPDHGVPGGIPLSKIITNDAGTLTLAAHRTFSEGYQSQYLTTEVWTGFDEVWVQPMYVAIDGHDADGTPTRIMPWHPIFGVGDRSAFYSPYWQIVYFEVPPGEQLESFRSARDVLDRGLNLTPGGGTLAVLAPSDVGVPPQILTPPPGQEGVGGPKTGSVGLLDGENAPFLDFGGGTFTWNDDRVVEEAPIFMWVARDASGTLRTLDIPTVAGTGPLYSNRLPKEVNDKPLYGSYWRLYTVEVSPGMGVFAPPGTPYGDDLRDALSTTPGLVSFTYAPQIVTPTPPTTYAQLGGRVAANPSCFGVDIATNATNPCQFLDSQSAIETMVPGPSIKRTDIVVTCPYISYDTKAVPSP